MQIKLEKVAVLKKFFVDADYRGKEHRVGSRLYAALYSFAVRRGLETVVLDTPSVARRSHNFYRRAGFVQISADELPIDYDYANRDSLLFLLDLRGHA